MADNREILAVGILGLAAVVAFAKAAGAKLTVNGDTLSIGDLFNTPSGGPRRGSNAPSKNDNIPTPARKPDLSTLDQIYIKYGLQFGPDWRLLKALAQVESGERPTAKNAADPSYGLMQILCTTPSGNQLAACTNRFNVVGWNEATPERLLDADYNVKIGAQILQWNIATYGLTKGIAVYNNWGARNDPTNGPFRNQGYVDKVLAAYRSLGGAVSDTVGI